MNGANARLTCFELWGGNYSADHSIELPGFVGWINAAPLDPASSGGDVHYFSVCSKGTVTRIAVADVAGHGPQASSTAVKLREALKHHTNHWDQSALMQELNEAFLGASAEIPYATAAVLSFYRDTGELLFSNAGHPPPLWYRASERSWHFLEDCTPFAVDIEGLPLGVIPGTTYSQTGVKVGFGDLLVLYTDGITETIDSSNNELGNVGLLEMVKRLAAQPPVEVIRALTSDIQTFRGGAPHRDDETLIVLQCAGVT